MSEYWTTKDGTRIRMKDMSIQHLIYALKYLDRKVTIEKLKGGNSNRYHFHAIYLTQHELENELERRNRKSFEKDCKFM